MGLDKLVDDKTTEKTSTNKHRTTENEIDNIIDESDAKILNHRVNHRGASFLCKCQNCGEEFRKGASRVKNGDGIYCSQQCSNEGRKGKALKDVRTDDEYTLAYLGGLIYGDGGLDYDENNGQYRIRFTNTSILLINHFELILDSIGCNTSIIELDTKDKHSDLYNLSTKSKMLYDIINNNFTDVKSINEFCDDNYKKIMFIRGFYEAEGSIQEYRIRITQKNEDILFLIEEFLMEIIDDIDIKYTENNNSTNLVINGKKHKRKFIGLIQPLIKRGEYNG